MKRLVVVLSGLLVLPAFAEVAPIYYEDVIEMSDTEIADTDAVADVADDATDVQNNSSANTVSSSRTQGRATSSRAMAGSATRRANVTNSGTSSTRNLSTRASGSNSATTARATVSRASTTRAGTNGLRTTGAPGGTVSAASRGVAASRTVPASVNSARSAAPTANTARASIVQTDTVGTPLYNGRVASVGSVRARVPAVRMATASSNVSTTAVAETKVETKADAAASMDELAQMTDFCKAQYTQCMDNFCNVLDDNQGRCSCSANLKNYAKTETALKEATESLQNVAQQIQYIGLSKDDIENLFNQTEAELALSSNTDSSQLKSDLDRIKNMIVDVKTGTASVSTDNGLSFDLSGLLDFSISSTGFDLSSLFGNTNNANTSSISNQRGEQLYKTAAARCKAAVLTSCQSQGVDISVITNSYDLEIDKQCIAYERSLSDANDQMSATVRNAKSVLQKARLMVAQQKNSYDLRGCVNALDSCMQDEFVCGTDYENCLDPSGKYVVNGEIVVGSTPGVSGGNISPTTTEAKDMYSVWNYTDTTATTAFGKGSVPGYVEKSLYTSVNDMKAVTTNMAKYLQQKIGYVDSSTGKSIGMCVSILNKCQDYTYTTGKGNNKAYKPDNDVIRNYLERVSIQIKAAQDELLSSYAETCISDVSACLSQNNYGNLATITTDTGKVSAVAVSACRPVITSCMSVTGWGNNISGDMYNWLQTTLNTTVTGTYSTLGDVKNEISCLAIRGTWNASGKSCTCKTGTTFKYGICDCTDETKSWDEASATCK
ncbi:MAG: hypothetical protein K2M34_01070 [Alphaproteobacteria bacterium]|nr:hypothetical protein [Alphaproteobacteria bacterium]